MVIKEDDFIEIKDKLGTIESYDYYDYLYDHRDIDINKNIIYNNNYISNLKYSYDFLRFILETSANITITSSYYTYKLLWLLKDILQEINVDFLEI